MAWRSRTNWGNTVNDKPTGTDLNNLAKDTQGPWGGDIDAGAHSVANIRQLSVYGAGQATSAISAVGSTAGQLLIQDSGLNVDNGGVIVLAGGQNATGFGAIKGLLKDGVGNTLGDIAISTRRAHGDILMTESIRFPYYGGIRLSPCPNPGLPIPNTFHIFMDIADNKLKAIGPAGTTTILANA